MLKMMLLTLVPGYQIDLIIEEENIDKENLGHYNQYRQYKR